jgi:energy-coupling factor transporter ATP-binding protein EcfA2
MDNEREHVIEVTDLRRVYGGGFEAVRGITFSVGRGEIFALLGTNGAGKTSTVELLEGLARPAGDRVRVLGHDLYDDRGAVRPRTGRSAVRRGQPAHPGRARPRAELPPNALRPAVVLLGLALALVLAALDGAEAVAIRLSSGAALLPFGLLYGLIAPMDVFLRRSAALAVVLMFAFAWADPDPAGIVMVGVLTALGTLFSLLACRCGAWTLSVLWEAERAREVEARLAVAEERLRFGRDLHDVMGRNLAVIALKSELAVQLARRGRPEAVDQMIEVQRIAQESQREVRDVVRG